MIRLAIGDEVKVELPKGYNNRGILGVHVMFKTYPEAKFDGAVGTIVDFNPVGPNGLPLYLVDFRGHNNRVQIPWQEQWFRPEWLRLVSRPGEVVQQAAS